MSQNTSSAVMAQRIEPRDSLDFFPTPPWATRALMEHVLKPHWDDFDELNAWEPAAGEGHMAEVLREYFRHVHASDVHDYGRGYAVGSFTGEGADTARCPRVADWVITNPPFNLAEAFLRRAQAVARRGIALLVRMAWLETGERYREIFSRTPPSQVALFAERVPMAKGRWDPKGSTATAYAWVIWRVPFHESEDTHLVWIPPGQRQALTRTDDVRRFAPQAEPVALFGRCERTA